MASQTKETAGILGLGKRLADARKRAGLTQEEAGQRVGKDKRTVIRWEKGETVPGVDYVKMLADASGSDAAWIVMGEDSPVHATMAGVRALLQGACNLLDGPPKPTALVQDILDQLHKSERTHEDTSEDSGGSNNGAAGGGCG